MSKLSIVILAVCCLFASCDFISDKKIRGDGNNATEQRTLPAFEGIRAYGAFDISVSSGSEQSVRIEADANLLPYIETSMEGDIVRIGTKKGYNVQSRRDIRIIVVSPGYSMIRLYGSGNIISENQLLSKDKINLAIVGSGDLKVDLKASSVDVELSGSGDMKLSGETGEMSIRINGSGDVFAGKLKSANVTVGISGSGSAEVTANQKLDVTVSGSGDVKYAGNAQVNSRISGSGSVIKMK